MQWLFDAVIEYSLPLEDGHVVVSFMPVFILIAEYYRGIVSLKANAGQPIALWAAKSGWKYIMARQDHPNMQRRWHYRIKNPML